MKNILYLYLPNRPPMTEFAEARLISELVPGDIHSIIAATGNHWRKIFSIFAKLSFSLDNQGCKTWQDYREQLLLTTCGREKICFEPVICSDNPSDIHLIAGKNHFAKFGLSADHFTPIDTEGRILRFENIFLTPYFDYRQFPNALIEQLTQTLKAMVESSCK